jgi:hypothetical protein
VKEVTTTDATVGATAKSSAIVGSKESNNRMFAPEIKAAPARA